jgi:transcriptional regulator with XRE-family HTH domain
MAATVTDVTDVLGAVGPRLRSIRQEQEATLSDIAGATGISISTLSRLESGRRRPNLELLLPLAKVYGVPLDDLVSPPPTDDPRVRYRPTTRFGMTMVALSRRTGGIQSFKLIIPVNEERELHGPRTHQGYEWLYVLDGRLRLLLGDRDLVLSVGEAAEFDTRVPHWFGSAGPGPVELLSLFGREGERVHVRARSTTR